MNAREKEKEIDRETERERERERESLWGQGITFKDTPPVAYFLQLDSTS
jgi:hypothetical protein